MTYTLTKEHTIEQLTSIFRGLGFYLPYARVKNHVQHDTYKKAVSTLIGEGIPNARAHFALLKEELREQEKAMYDIAKLYGRV